jgi:hypothetical protein
MRSVERFLIRLDGWPWSAIARVGLGFAISPVFYVLTGGRDSAWGFAAYFIGVLVLLRVVPAALRLALPFSREAKQTWADRRILAKRYDSYQWQKLFWVGLGLLLFVIAAGGASIGELVVTIACLIGGSLGLWIWRRVSTTRSAQ